jgi:drug/metabolite transporter (DMT)-like permease
VNVDAGRAALPAGLAVGLACGLVVPFIWSGWIVASRFGVTHALTPYDVTALRVGVAAILVAPYALRRGLGGLSIPKALVVSAGAGALFGVTAFGGMSLAPVAHAGVLANGTMPIVAALLGYVWLGQRLRASQFAGMALILAGVLAIGGDGLFNAAQPGEWLGDLLFVASGALFAMYMTALRAWNVQIRQAIVAVPVVSSIVYLPIWIVWLPSGLLPGIAGTGPLPPWPEIALQTVYQGMVASLLVVVLVTRATRSVGPTVMAVFLSAVPGMATLLAIPLLGEWPTPLAVGGLVVATAGMLLAVGLRRPGAAA